MKYEACVCKRNGRNGSKTDRDRPTNSVPSVNQSLGGKRRNTANVNRRRVVRCRVQQRSSMDQVRLLGDAIRIGLAYGMGSAGTGRAVSG